MSLINNENNSSARLNNESSPLLPEQSQDTLEAEVEGSNGKLGYI